MPRYVTTFATTSNNEYFPLMLIKLLEHEKENVPVVEDVLHALWFRARYKCHAELLSHFPALIPILCQLLGMYETNGTVIMCTASLIVSLCKDNEEARRLFGVEHNVSTQLTHLLRLYKANENVALAIFAAIGSLSSSESNTLVFGKLEGVFDILVELLPCFTNSTKMIVLMNALDSLCKHDQNVEIIAETPYFCQRLFDVLKQFYATTAFMKSWCSVVERLSVNRRNLGKFLSMGIMFWDSLRKALQAHAANDDVSLSLCRVLINLTSFSSVIEKSNTIERNMLATVQVYLELWKKGLRLRDNSTVIQSLCQSIALFAEQKYWFELLMVDRQGLMESLNECQRQYPQHFEIMTSCKLIQLKLTSL